jgi:hypothetical protein
LEIDPAWNSRSGGPPWTWLAASPKSSMTATPQTRPDRRINAVRRGLEADRDVTMGASYSLTRTVLSYLKLRSKGSFGR